MRDRTIPSHILTDQTTTVANAVRFSVSIADGLYVLRVLEKNLKMPIAAICTYEAVVLYIPRDKKYSKYVPPVSSILNKHRWLLPVFVAALVAHVLGMPE